MGNFIDCWNSLKSKGYKHPDGSPVLGDNERASIESRIKEHIGVGVDPTEAARLAVQSHLEESHGQLQSVYDQLRERYPHLSGQEAPPQTPAATEPTTAQPLPKTEPAPPVEKPPVQTPTQPKLEFTGSSDQPVISRIANRFVDERVASGELGEVAPGQGFSTRELAARGARMSPEEATQHISDLMNKTGDPIKQAQAVRAEEARLSQRSEEASRKAQANPNDISARQAQDEAFKDLTDFHNGPVAQLKQVFHGTGMGLQGEIPVDLSTYNGLRAKWLKETGEAPPKHMEARMQKTAEQVRGALDEENGAMKKLGDAIEKKVGRSKLPSPEEVADNIQSRMKVEPCLV